MSDCALRFLMCWSVDRRVAWLHGRVGLRAWSGSGLLCGRVSVVCCCWLACMCCVWSRVCVCVTLLLSGWLFVWLVDSVFGSLSLSVCVLAGPVVCVCVSV